MNRLNQSREHVLIAINVVTVLTLIGLCVHFYGETTNEAAIAYSFSLDFPETSAVARNEQMVFHIVRILGDIVGGLSLCRIQAVEMPSAKTGIMAAIPFSVVMAVLITVFWNRMIINLIIPVLLCLESLFFLRLCMWNKGDSSNH